MLHGYSIVLGMTVPAEVVEHGDCADGQIVCPVCKEAAFKVSASETVKRRGYLSHYRRDPEKDAECSLRVDSMTEDEIAKSDDEEIAKLLTSKGQAKERFHQVLDDMIGRLNQNLQDTRVAGDLKRHKEAHWIIDTVADAYLLNHNNLNIARDAACVMMEITQPLPPLVLAYRKRVVHDLVNAVHISDDKDLARVLARWALTMGMQPMYYEQVEDELTRMTIVALRKVVQTSRGKAKQIIETLYNPPGWQDKDGQTPWQLALNDIIDRGSASVLGLMPSETMTDRIRATLGSRMREAKVEDHPVPAYMEGLREAVVQSMRDDGIRIPTRPATPKRKPRPKRTRRR